MIEINARAALCGPMRKPSSAGKVGEAAAVGLLLTQSGHFTSCSVHGARDTQTEPDIGRNPDHSKG